MGRILTLSSETSRRLHTKRYCRLPKEWHMKTDKFWVFWAETLEQEITKKRCVNLLKQVYAVCICGCMNIWLHKCLLVIFCKRKITVTGCISLLGCCLWQLCYLQKAKEIKTLDKNILPSDLVPKGVRIPHHHPCSKLCAVVSAHQKLWLCPHTNFHPKATRLWVLHLLLWFPKQPIVLLHVRLPQLLLI